jgi:hypothetical protein
MYPSAGPRTKFNPVNGLTGRHGCTQDTLLGRPCIHPDCHRVSVRPSKKDQPQVLDGFHRLPCSPLSGLCVALHQSSLCHGSGGYPGRHFGNHRRRRDNHPALFLPVRIQLKGVRPSRPLYERRGYGHPPWPSSPSARPGCSATRSFTWSCPRCKIRSAYTF